jgi:hypothetical protein
MFPSTLLSCGIRMSFVHRGTRLFRIAQTDMCQRPADIMAARLLDFKGHCHVHRPVHGSEYESIMILYVMWFSDSVGESWLVSGDAVVLSSACDVDCSAAVHVHDTDRRT